MTNVEKKEDRNVGLSATFRQGSIYATGIILRRVVSLIMLPIYTRFLTPANYGVLELLAAVVDFAGLLVGLRVTQTVVRFYVSEDNMERRRELISTIFILLLIAGTIAISGIALAATPISSFLFGTTEYSTEVALFGVTLLTAAVTNAGLSLLRAQMRPWAFLALSALQLLVQVILNIVFVVVLEWAVYGVVISAVIAGTIIACIVAIYMLRFAGLRFRFAIAKRLYAFVWPLMLASVAGFIGFYSDRYLLRVLSDLTTVGLYAVAARLVFTTKDLIVAPWHSAWSVQRFEVAKREDAHVIFRRAFKVYSLILVLFAVAVSLLALNVIKILAPEPFWEAADIAPILAIAAVTRGLILFCNFGALYGERTHIVNTATWSGLIVRIAAFLLMIPTFGMFGAAIGVVAGDVVVSMWIYFRSKKQYDMELDWKPFWIASLMAIVVVVAAYFGWREASWALTANIGALVLYTILLYIMPFWSAQERSDIRQFCTSTAHKLRNVTSRKR